MLLKNLSTFKDGCFVNNDAMNQNPMMICRQFFPKTITDQTFSSSFNYMDELLMFDVSGSDFWKLWMF